MLTPFEKILFASRTPQGCPSPSPGASVAINLIKTPGMLFLRWKHSPREMEEMPSNLGWHKTPDLPWVTISWLKESRLQGDQPNEFHKHFQPLEKIKSRNRAMQMKGSSCWHFQTDPLFHGFCWDPKFFPLAALSSKLKSSKKLMTF